jgi:hypothetical protein
LTSRSSISQEEVVTLPVPITSSMFEDTGLYHRQPVGFGPSLGPR